MFNKGTHTVSYTGTHTGTYTVSYTGTYTVSYTGTNKGLYNGLMHSKLQEHIHKFSYIDVYTRLLLSLLLALSGCFCTRLFCLRLLKILLESLYCTKGEYSRTEWSDE